MGDSDSGTFDVAGSAKAELPAYFRDGIPDGAGGTVPVRASWRGGPSIDQYSGPLTAFPIVVPLLKDRALAARLVRHFDCFAKRLRVHRITHLSENPEVAQSVGAFLGSTATNLEPGDPDLSNVDEIWAFFLPQRNGASAAGYGACPANLAFDMDDESFELDARDPMFQGRPATAVRAQASVQPQQHDVAGRGPPTGPANGWGSGGYGGHASGVVPYLNHLSGVAATGTVYVRFLYRVWSGADTVYRIGYPGYAKQATWVVQEIAR